MSREESAVQVRRYTGQEPEMQINRREVLRYAMTGGEAEEADAALRGMTDSVLREMQDAFDFRVCYRRMPLNWEAGKPCLPFGSESAQLARLLAGCGEMILFAATAGMEADRRIARYQRISPTKALLAQALGAERAETLCDAFCGDMRREARAEGLACTPRFSPGYGDLPLAAQKDFFRLLDCERKIGLYLNESLLMTPSKSVTAIFGLRKEDEP